MTMLQRLRADHAPALLAFERENRAYFAATVPDRGDAYFTGFDTRLAELLAGQAAGEHHFHLLTDTSGAVLGRVNLVDVADGSAELGYRIAERAAGQGLATAAAREVCRLARTGYGLRSLRAATTTDNGASRTVLTRAGFVECGGTTLSGLPGLRYLRVLGEADGDG
ncbi:GNAT family N-acetyltransferase [Streptomyces sp. NRRL WC-3549]|uniref:GNAT family N-acetyltransferase n=1 Tax=Streptomyces sp. NRRL WC-3549 TaxID=1463925 RepID=UPI0004C85E1C|nr:GNAT family N-acetyltransferase [Streptomyces sp. NRRL WC-3549]